MVDYNYIQYKEHGGYNYILYKEHKGLQLYTVSRAWVTTTIYSIKSMEDCNYIQYKEHGGLQLYTV